MVTVDDHLERLAALIEQPQQRANAEAQLRGLFVTLGKEELRVYEPDLRQLISHFLPKRRKALEAELDRLVEDDPPPPPPPPPPRPADTSQRELEKLETRMQENLANLRDRRIFQWSTAYRDYLFEEFETIAALARDWYDPEPVATIVLEQLRTHAHDIFIRGFEHAIEGLPQDLAIARQLTGLQRFLELPIEIYTARTARADDAPHALRLLISATFAGIITGFADCDFQTTTGATTLSTQPQWWAHQLGFISAPHLRALLNAIGDSSFHQGLSAIALPLATAIDTLINDGRGAAALPVISQFVSDTRRLDIAFRPAALNAGKFIDVHCYLDATATTLQSLEESAARNVALVAARLRSDLHEWVVEHRTLRSVLVNVTDDAADQTRAHTRINELLGYALADHGNAVRIDQPLRANFAENFPIQQGLLPRVYHVYRASVRELLRTFERRNGVRAWSSVRRSGKTTATFDLASNSASTVVAQTCTTGARPETDSLFFRRVQQAVDQRERLPHTFFRDTVKSCAPDRPSGASRFVFVIDEYERLFEELGAAEADNAARLRVVLPLLDQMAAFSRDNLLVFLGQEPNAHTILMDQNPLSPYVVQDSFPLFRHDKGERRSEFSELLRKVLIEPVRFDATFADAIFDETAGHPFLTVKLLVAFVDWLIQQERLVSQLSFTADDFLEFSPHGLSKLAISRSDEYSFFARAAAWSLSTEGRNRSPWAHAVYTVLTRLAQETWPHLSCSMSDFRALVEDAVPPDLNYTPEYLLTSAERANFFAVDGDHVRPKIKLLARVAGVSTRQVSGVHRL